MADEPQGPGWWQASDGKWYPPELHPSALQPQPSPPTQLDPTEAIGAPPLDVGQQTAWSPPAWAPPVEPPKRGPRRGVVIAVTVVAVVVVAVVAAFALGTKSDKKTGAAASSDETAVSDETDTTSSASVPPGYRVISDNGLSIAVPTGWTKFDPSAIASNSDQLSDLAAANSDTSDLLNFGAEVLAKNAKLAAHSSSGRQILAIVKLPVAIDPTDPSASDQMSAVLESAGATGVDVRQTSLAAGLALRVTSTLMLNLPNGGSVTEDEVVYVVRVGKSTYEVTLVAVGGASTEDFDTIANTFAVG